VYGNIVVISDEPHKLKNFCTQIIDKGPSQQLRQQAPAVVARWLAHDDTGTPAATMCNHAAAPTQLQADGQGAPGLPSTSGRAQDAPLIAIDTLFIAVLKLVDEHDSCTPAERRARFACGKPASMLPMLSGIIDKQNVPCAQALVGNTDLHDQLCKDGHSTEALIMQLVSRAFEAFDMSGLTPMERTLRIAERSLMVSRILGNSWYVRDTRDSVSGFTKQLLASWLFNADMRQFVLDRLPEHQRKWLIDRCFSSDVIELLFSLMVQLCGYKPSQRQLEGINRRLQFLQSQKQMSEEDRGYSQRKRNTAHYSHHALEASGSKQWNDGSKVSDASERLHRDQTVQRTAERMAEVKQDPVRNHFK
jgi:hypothetical protein